jgi:hypothetical protein
MARRAYDDTDLNGLARWRQRRHLRGGLLLLAGVIVAMALVACGGSSNSSGGSTSGGGTSGGSGKPSYCSELDNLKQSITDLSQIKVIQNGTNAVKAGFDKVKNNANATIDAAKSDFSSETSALKSSITKLGNSVSDLSSSPLTAAAAIPGEVSAVKTATENLVNATRSKCK